MKAAERQERMAEARRKRMAIAMWKHNFAYRTRGLDWDSHATRTEQRLWLAFARIADEAAHTKEEVR